MNQVDLQQLAVERSDPAKPRLQLRRHVTTRYMLPGALLVGLGLLLLWAVWETLFPPQPVTVTPVLVADGPVKRGGVALFEAAGWVEPRPTPIRVPALAPGVVEQLLVVEDEPVSPGQPIAELVKEDAQLALKQAEADLKLRQAELAEAQATLAAAITRWEQPVHLEAVLGEAEAALAKIQTQLTNLPFESRRAKAEMDFALLAYQQMKAVRGSAAPRELQQAKSQWESAQASVEELRNRRRSLTKEKEAFETRRDALRKQLALLANETQAKDEAAAQVQAAQSRVEQMQVALDQAKLRLSRMTIRAPVAGRVYRLIAPPGARMMAEMGHTLSHDASTVVTLYRAEMLQVRVDVRFEDIPKVELGQPVRIANAALESPLKGKVLYISSEANIQKNTLQVKVAIESPELVLKPEMLVDATFLAVASRDTQSDSRQRLMIPQRLVQQDDRGQYVWAADQSAGVARRMTVETGDVNANGLVEVAGELNSSTRVIAGGHEGLRDGDRVRITGEYDGAG